MKWVLLYVILFHRYAVDKVSSSTGCISYKLRNRKCTNLFFTIAGSRWRVSGCPRPPEGSESGPGKIDWCGDQNSQVRTFPKLSYPSTTMRTKAILFSLVRCTRYLRLSVILDRKAKVYPMPMPSIPAYRLRRGLQVEIPCCGGRRWLNRLSRWQDFP